MPHKWTFARPPRPAQSEALDWIDAEPEPVLLGSLPTGVGKSAIAMSVAHGSSGIVLTPQNLLLDQYPRDWPEAAKVKGAVNYSCNSYSGMDCLTGRAIGCRSGNTCPYRMDKQIFQNSNVSLTNYSFFATANDIPKRDWLICDEMHAMEENILGAYEVIIDQKLMQACGKMVELPSSDELPQDRMEALEVVNGIIEEIWSHVVLALATCQEAAGSGGRSKSLADKIRVLSQFMKAMEFMAADYEGYIVQAAAKQIVCRPLFARNIMSSLLKPFNRVLGMSATPPPLSCLDKWFGMGDAAVLEAEHPFAVENRKVFPWPAASLNARNMDTELPKVVSRIEKIMDTYKDDKGIIPCHSFSLGEKIFKLLGNRYRNRIINHTYADNREDLVNHFIASEEPSVLMSPSITEGFDFHDDLSRFCIIPKMPYASLGDRWVKTRAAVDDKWYTWSAMRSVVQACGRSIRHDEDWADSYILDSQWNRIAKSGLLPSWFTDSIQ